MNTKKLAGITSCTIILGLVSAASLAEHPRREFNKTVKRDHAVNVYTRTIEQRRIDNGVQRSARLETSDGRSATREATYSRDRQNQTATRTVSGTRLNGATYSGETIRQRTENGFEQNTTRTNAKGEVATRNKHVAVDKDAGLITKEIQYTRFNGESGGKTVIVERH